MSYLNTRLKDIPNSNDYIQHFGIPGMKWGWTKDGRKTGAKEAMTEDERKARRQQLLKKVGTALGVAAAVGGTALAIRNRKKLGTAIRDKVNRFKDQRMFAKVNKKIKLDKKNKEKVIKDILKKTHEDLNSRYDRFVRSGKKAHWDNTIEIALNKARRKTRINPFYKKHL